MMPIFSLGEVAENDCDVLLQKHGGKIIDLETSENDMMIKCYGVCFLRITVAPELLSPPTFGGPGRSP